MPPASPDYKACLPLVGWARDPAWWEVLTSTCCVFGPRLCFSQGSVELRKRARGEVGDSVGEV